MSRVLVIGDTHAPCMREDYVPFLKKTYREYNCNKVVHIGDLVDWASISYHAKAAGLLNSELELLDARKQVKRLYKAFPKATWCIGNHDSLTIRKAKDAGLPPSVLRDYADLWNVQGWEVIPAFDKKIIDGVIYQHGDRGKAGQVCGAFLNAKDEHMPVVQGHHHSQFGVLYHANVKSRIWGMQTGCGIDYKKAAMDYGKKFNSKPILGCGVVINGVTAIPVPMNLK